MISAHARELKIDEEFRSLIPPLTLEERTGLETSLLHTGCLDALVVWSEPFILLDGHNRKEICDRHGIDYEIRTLSFPDRNAAKRWIIEHQFGRRNLTPYQRAELALTLKPILAAEAKKRQQAGGGVARQNSNELTTNQCLARLSNISHDTVARANYLSHHADEETKERLRRGETSIHAEYTKMRRPHVTNNAGNNESYLRSFPDGHGRPEGPSHTLESLGDGQLGPLAFVPCKEHYLLSKRGHQMNTEPSMTTFATGAVRSSDADNVRFDLITPIGLRRLAETCAEGANKYGSYSWTRGIPASQMLNHAVRHIYLWLEGDHTEDHLAHAAWNILGVCHFEEAMPEMIDVPTRGHTS